MNSLAVSSVHTTTPLAGYFKNYANFRHNEWGRGELTEHEKLQHADNMITIFDLLASRGRNGTVSIFANDISEVEIKFKGPSSLFGLPTAPLFLRQAARSLGAEDHELEPINEVCRGRIRLK